MLHESSTLELSVRFCADRSDRNGDLLNIYNCYSLLEPYVQTGHPRRSIVQTYDRSSM